MGRVRRGLVAAAVAASFAGMFGPVPAHSFSAGPFHTSGNQILDANNQVVRFRGITAGILQDYPYINTPNDVTDASFDVAKSWGVNAVRVPLSEQYWFQSWGCKYKISPEDYQANVATVVNRITSRGMLAILDLHVNSKQNTMMCSSGQQPMADSPRAVTFWRQAAYLFQGNPLVAFDLFNEPHDIPWSIWRDGGRMFDLSGYWNAAGMQQMYNGIRGTGAQNLIFVSGNGWATTPPPADYLLDGYNIVYAAHAYTTSQPRSILDKWTTLAQTQPVAVSEFGWSDNNDPSYNSTVISWAEAHGLSWLAFIWNPGPQYALITDVYSFQPTPAAIPVKQGVALNL